MELSEFYTSIGSDFDEVAARLESTALIARLVGKFAEDPSFSELERSLAAGEVEPAFRAAHTLKGISANVGFSGLYKSASALTELLRTGSLDGAAPLFGEVKAEYEKILSGIAAL